MHTGIFVLVSGTQWSPEVANKVYSELIQRRVGIKLITRLACRTSKTVQRRVMFVGRKEANFCSGAIKRVEDLDGWPFQGDAMVDGTPAFRIGSVYENGR
jgi:hypothetical protein